MSDFNAAAALSALKSGKRGGPPPPPLEQAAFDAAHAAVMAALPGGTDALLDAAQTAWARADRLFDTIRTTPAFALGVPPAACRKGCGWCCHQPIGAAAIEILAMARALAGRPEARAVAGWKPGTPCAFLKDGACSIYDIRPLKCRSLWHLDVRHCMTRYANLPVMAATVSSAFQLEPKMIYEGALKGLALPLIKAGHDCPGLEMMPALQQVLGDTTAPARWLRGEAVFAESLRLDWFPRPVKGRRR
jgi:hypothetical protein